MSDDEIIDKVLIEYKNSMGDSFHEVYERALEKVSKQVAADMLKANEALELMLHYDLIEVFEYPYYKITGQGVLINNNGGWLKNVVNETKKAMAMAQEESVKKEKLKLDLQLVKLKKFAFWPLFALGLFGGVYSFIDLIDNQSKKEDVEQMKQSIEQMELELSKLRTSLSDQKIDTLSHSSNSDKKE